MPCIGWPNGEQVPLIDLQEMTRVLFEALGEEGSKRAFVHYPAGTYPGQDKALADNTHFNPYGAYQIARCVIEGMKQARLPFVDHLREDVQPFRPSVRIVRMRSTGTKALLWKCRNPMATDLSFGCVAVNSFYLLLMLVFQSVKLLKLMTGE